MGSLEDGFRKTLSSFKKRLTQEEQSAFQFATLEDVRLEVTRIQAEQANQKEMMNMTRIQSFLEAMDQFGKVIEVFLNSSEFVPFIWGPVKFVLQVASNPKPQLSALLEESKRCLVIRARIFSLHQRRFLSLGLDLSN